MRVVLEGNAQEIATFVLAAQGQRMPMEVNPIALKTIEDKKILADSIRNVLENQQKIESGSDSSIVGQIERR